MYRSLLKDAQICLTFIMLFVVGLSSTVDAQNSRQHLLWQIGKPDNEMREFALAPDRLKEFTKDGFFVVGRSNEKNDWPYCHPGPDDAWAGNKQHAFSVFFGIKHLVKTGNCQLKFKLMDVGNAAVKLSIQINGQEFKSVLPKGAGTGIKGDVEKGKKYAFEITIPASILVRGDNKITITTEAGSWFIYDWVGFEAPSGITLGSVRTAVAIAALKGLPFISAKGNLHCQSAELSLTNTGDSTDITIHVPGLPAQVFGVARGNQQIEILTPAVAKDSSLKITIGKEGKMIDRRTVTIRPVAQMTIYILPHSHNDIGYTEIQTNVEKKQINNLLQGIEYAKRTKDYPEGARFVWNLEGSYAADLYLQRMNEQQKKDFYEAVKNGGVALNGMYLNTLTGLCRPEELLQLFKFSNGLARKCDVKVDAAMISDVPGYTWGTVTAMAQAGIKYFSAAPNYFDRIGDILQKWEDKPFYWVSPSGKEKVLVWIPYKGYALSHGIARLSEKFVSAYVGQLKSIGYPYDISYIRWSGHGDNAVPEIEICDFVKQWNEKYEWPRFIISSTSTAFSAFENKYGSQLPSVKGDWTGYWEDGAGSSAFETAQNRASSSRLTQAETLWAMVDPDHYPIDKIKAAWRHVILYSEHTWGADISIMNPLSQKTIEQWDIKKSYATAASDLSTELLAGALPKTGDEAAAGAIDVFNTNSWERTNLVLVTPLLSASGDVVKDAQGKTIPSQRLSTGELAFVAKDVPPFAARRFFISTGKSVFKGEVHASDHSLDNGVLRIGMDDTTGAIKSIRNYTINNNFVDSVSGNYANDYLFLNGNNLANLQRNGPVKISVKEKGPVLATLLIESAAPGCNKLAREIRLVNGFDYVEMTNILDKKPATLNPHPGDYAWANTGGKESINFGFPFNVSDGAMKLGLPMAIMRPEIEQIPGSCKNWLEVDGWADVSNKDFGITWATLDAPLVQVGGITATMLGGQTNPDVWRKKIDPTQKLYSWALNNHWETNYRAYQDGVITFRYALKPHHIFEPVDATKFAAGLAQPLIIKKALGKERSVPKLMLSSKNIVVFVLKPSEDGKAWIVTLFNSSDKPEKTTLHWSEPVKATSYSNTGEMSLAPLPGEIEMGTLEVVTIRVDK